MTADDAHLEVAARLALRGHGRAEPNPLVGCVIVAPDGQQVGWGYHEQCGGPHAEIHALRRAGAAARGSTVYVTLEPCAHVGRTGPCADALIEAGVRRVVVARRDPNPPAGGGLDRLRAAGIDVAVSTTARRAAAVAAPFAHRIDTGLPWVIAKWAQTLDGRIATRTGASQFLSGPASRRLVHQERGRVCAILTGIGTVLADDPLLTARGVRVRRHAHRIVIDPALEIPPTAQLVTTAAAHPTTVVCTADALAARTAHRDALEQAGLEILAVQTTAPGELPVVPALRTLAARHDLTNVLVEAGPGLVGRLFAEGLVSEAWVFVAPLLFGDADAKPCARGRVVERLDEGISLQMTSRRLRGDDVILRYGVSPAPSRSGIGPADTSMPNAAGVNGNAKLDE